MDLKRFVVFIFMFIILSASAENAPSRKSVRVLLNPYGQSFGNMQQRKNVASSSPGQRPASRKSGGFGSLE